MVRGVGQRNELLDDDRGPRGMVPPRWNLPSWKYPTRQIADALPRSSPARRRRHWSSPRNVPPSSAVKPASQRRSCIRSSSESTIRAETCVSTMAMGSTGSHAALLASKHDLAVPALSWTRPGGEIDSRVPLARTPVADGVGPSPSVSVPLFISHVPLHRVPSGCTLNSCPVRRWFRGTRSGRSGPWSRPAGERC